MIDNTSREKYETPQASVREVFLLEGLPDMCTSTHGVIRQNSWETGETYGGQNDPDGDVWVTFD
jgi:hypothetical protein